MKTLSNSEKKILVNIAEDLQRYWKHNRDSKLGRIYGCYTLNLYDVEIHVSFRV